MIVALSGRKQSGKSTTAALLERELGFKPIAFADQLKKFTAAFLGLPFEEVNTDSFKTRDVLVPLYGGEVKLTGRDVLQRLGTQAARQVFGDNFWIDQLIGQVAIAGHKYIDDVDGSGRHGCGHWMESATNDDGHSCGYGKSDHQHVVITDARFFNELAALRVAGAFIVRVNCAGASETRHSFEQANGMPGRGVTCSHFYPTDDVIRKDNFTATIGNACSLPAASHPSHYSGDTHASETTLPDLGACYDTVIESASAEATAMMVLNEVRERMARDDK